MGIPISQLVSVKHGVGTWMHEDMFKSQYNMYSINYRSSNVNHNVNATPQFWGVLKWME